MTNVKSKRSGLNYEAWLEELFDSNGYQFLFHNNEISTFTGIGRIFGKEVAFYGQNPRIEQGFVCSVGALEIEKIQTLAHSKMIPLVSLICSPGVSVKEGLLSGHHYTKVIVGNIKLSGVIPQISIILGMTQGAPAYSAVLSDFVLFNKSRSSLSVTGPVVIKNLLGVETTIRELAGSEVHAEKTGIADFVDKDIQTQLKRARALISYLPANFKEKPSQRFAVKSRTHMPVIPKSSKEIFNIFEVINYLADDGEFMEFRADYAKSVVCVFCYLGGQNIGIIANQSLHEAGALDKESSLKAARFLKICDSYNIPVINLIDVPGFMPGVEQEHGGLLQSGAQLCQAMQTNGKRFSIILRKCYGAAAFIMMQTRYQGGHYVLSLNDAKIAVMGLDGASTMLGVEMTSEEYYERYESPKVALLHGIIDEIIEMKDLRSRLIKLVGDNEFDCDIENKSRVMITPL